MKKKLTVQASNTAKVLLVSGLLLAILQVCRYGLKVGEFTPLKLNPWNISQYKADYFRIGNCPPAKTTEGELCRTQYLLRLAGYSALNGSVDWMYWIMTVFLVYYPLIYLSIRPGKQAGRPPKETPKETKDKEEPHGISPLIFPVLTAIPPIVLLVFVINNFFVDRNEWSIYKGQEYALGVCRAFLKERNLTGDNRTVIYTSCLDLMTKRPNSGYANGISQITLEASPR